MNRCDRLGYILRHVGPAIARSTSGCFYSCCEHAYFLTTPRPPVSSTVIIAGSERSGTSWLAEMLNAPGIQTVVEPFGPLANSSIRYHLSLRRCERESSIRWSRRYLRASDEDHEMLQKVQRVLVGRDRNYWTNVLAKQIRPRRFLIKTVHANLMLGFIGNRFRNPVVLIQRHPCAVVASRLRGFGGTFRSDYLSAMLAQPTLVDDWLSPHVDAIAAEQDHAVRHGIEWAIENAVARKSLIDVPHRVVRYENLLCDAINQVAALNHWLQLGRDDSKLTPSKLSYTSDRAEADHNALLNDWRQELSSTRIDKILAWTDRFGLSDLITNDKSR